MRTCVSPVLTKPSPLRLLLLAATFFAPPAICFAQSRQQAGDSFVYASWHGTTSEIYSLSLSQADTSPRKLASVTHAASMPVTGSTSPDGTLLTYLRIPPLERSPLNAELWLLETASLAPRRLDTGVNGYWAPRWACSGDSFLYIKTLPEVPDARGRQGTALYLSAPTSLTPALLLIDSESLALFPVGLDPLKRTAYVQRVFPEGDSLWSVSVPEGRMTRVASLSVQAAWNVRLSDDCSTALASVRPSSESTEYRLITVGLASGTIQTVEAGLHSHYGAIWSRFSPEPTVLISDQAQALFKGVVRKTIRTARAERFLATGDEGLAIPLGVSRSDVALLRRYAPDHTELLLLGPNYGSPFLIPYSRNAEFLGVLFLPESR